jgi:hypothetical protein
LRQQFQNIVEKEQYLCCPHFIDIIRVYTYSLQNINAGKPFGSQYQIMDAKEEKRKRDRERYAQWSNEEKQEMLKNRRGADQKNKKDEKEEMLKKRREAYQQSTKEDKEKILKKRREAYQQKKTKESEERDEKKEEILKKQREAYQQNKTVRCAQKRQRYANMQPEQKKARIEKVAANKILKRNTPCKESIAMVNPAYIETEQEGRTST